MTDTLVDPLAHGPITPQIEHAVWSSCTSVPGLLPIAIEVTPAASGSLTAATVTMNGWSPALNACTIHHTVMLNPSAPTFDQDLLAMLAPLVASQARRAADAFDHGIGMPLNPGMARPIHRHLSADASHLAMALDDGITRAREGDGREHDADPLDNEYIVEQVVRSATDTLQFSNDGETTIYDGGALIRSSACLAWECRNANGLMHRCVVLPSKNTRQGDTGRLTIMTRIDGVTQVTLKNANVPDSVVASMADRSLGEILDLPRRVADILATRRILDADCRSDTLCLGLTSLDMCLAEFDGLTPRAAREHLIDLITEAQT